MLIQTNMYMRTLLLSVFALSGAMVASAQTTASFESLPLPSQNSYYVDYSAPGTDVGFNDGLAHFPCVYDTSFGFSYWSYGFAYSNMRDSVTPGFGNQYSAITSRGFSNSGKYAVAYGANNMLPLTGAAIGKPVQGFYITNSTYAYYSMRDGDAFAKKFGDSTGDAPDWFKLTVFGYRNGQLKPDSVVFYLADYRDSNNANDYIVRTWQWVNLLPLGSVDSLQFSLSSSDNGMFGMNTPAYFCMDNFKTSETTSATDLAGMVMTVYPNPATDYLIVNLNDNAPQIATITDVAGRLISSFSLTQHSNRLPLSSLLPGVYMLRLSDGVSASTLRFIKN